MIRSVLQMCNRPSAKAGGLLFLAVLALAPHPVHAQDMTTRIERLERDIDTLSRSVFRGENPKAVLGAAANAANAQTAQYDQLATRVNQLENDLRELTNRSEEQGNLLNQINRAIEDLAVRLRTVEQGAAANVGTSATPTGSSSMQQTAPTVSAGPNDPASSAQSPTIQSLGAITSAAAVPTDPTFLYENALELLKQRDYALAEKSLTDFLTAYPNHQLAGNAKYWLGETYFVQDRFDQAARIFAEGYQKYPKGPKAADNLLKLGLSLAAQNNTNDACVALKQIAKDFPTGAGAVKSRADSEIKKLKCS